MSFATTPYACLAEAEKDLATYASETRKAGLLLRRATALFNKSHSWSWESGQLTKIQLDALRSVAELAARLERELEGFAIKPLILSGQQALQKERGGDAHQ